MKSAVVILIIFYCSVANGQRFEDGCCLPEQFSAHVHLGSESGIKSMYSLLKVNYDFINKKKKVVNHLYYNGINFNNITILEDYNTNKRYVMIRDDMCWEYPNMNDMSDRCQIKTGRLVGTSYFGPESDNLEFGTFRVETTKKIRFDITVDAISYITVSKPDCIPIKEVLKYNFWSTDRKQYMSFYGVQTTVDHDVFDVPAICISSPSPISDLHEALNYIPGVGRESKESIEHPDAMNTVLNFVLT